MRRLLCSFATSVCATLAFAAPAHADDHQISQYLTCLRNNQVGPSSQEDADDAVRLGQEVAREIRQLGDVAVFAKWQSKGMDYHHIRAVATCAVVTRLDQLNP